LATLRWKGAAQAIAQVNTITVGGTAAAGQVYSVTINGKTVSYTTIGGDTNTTIAAALQALLAASTAPAEFAEVTWTAAATVITGTITSAATGTGTLITATATASSGPNNWDVAANWSTGAVPITGDTVFIEDTGANIKYGLNQSAVTLAVLNLPASFTGDGGLPETNTGGSASYLEYRPQYLQIGATIINVGDGPGQGSSRLKIDTGSVATTINVRQTAAGAEPNLEALQWKGTNAANVVNVLRGSVAIAGYGGDVATVATLTVGFVTSQGTDATVRCGAGATLTTINQNGGTLETNSGATTILKGAGSLTLNSGNVTTLTDDNGTSVYKGTGAIATVNVGSGATLDFSQDMRARTVTTLNLYEGSTLNDPFGTVVFTNPIHLLRCRIGDVTMDLGVNRNLAVS
jgi:trimeric autotransporter adhesin